MTDTLPEVTHVGGNFYQARNAKGDYYFGPKGNAEGYAAGVFSPTYRAVFSGVEESSAASDE